MTVARQRRRYRRMWRDTLRKETLTGRGYCGPYTAAELRLCDWEWRDWLRRFRARRKRLDTRPVDRAG